MEIQKIVFVFLVICFGCNNKTTEQKMVSDLSKPTVSDVSNTPFEQSTEVASNWQLADTLIKISLSNNSYFNYNFGDKESYKIEWGNNEYKNQSKQKFEVQGNGNLKLLGYDEKTIVLSQGCGTSCTYYVVLPMSNGKNEKVYNFAKAYDLENNLIAYIPEEAPPLTVRVENYTTGQYFDILEKNHCPAVFAADCINSCHFENKHLVLKWQGSNWKNEKDADIQEKKILISI